MSSYVLEVSKKSKQHVIDLLKEQIETEKEVKAAYQKAIGGVKNRPVKKIIRIMSLDCEKHINILEACIDVVKGTEVLMKDKVVLAESLMLHRQLGSKSIDIASWLLSEPWVKESAGLKELLKNWKKNEVRQRKFLKKITGKTFFRINEFDLIKYFRDEDFLEMRYLRSKRLIEKYGPIPTAHRW